MSISANGRIALSVSNGGPGIPRDAQPHVFDWFCVRIPRTHRSNGRSSGSGLGFAIARWIAELHGGQLELSEATASITMFTPSLPASPALMPEHSLQPVY